MLSILALYLLIGAVAGTVAGLFGLGGGVVIVPALVFSFAYFQFDPTVATHLAIGTSLACIAVTSCSAIYTHNQKGAVNWHLVKSITPGVIIGAWIGGQFASLLSGETLRAAFGVFLLVVALKMALSLKPHSERALPGTLGLSSAGLVIGSISALFGIGGGTLSVPFMTWCRVVMQQAVATSSAIGFPIAIAGTASYLYSGWDKALLPEYSLGFIYWPALLGIVLSSSVFARFGALLAHRLPARKLQLLFAALMAVIGIRFLL